MAMNEETAFYERIADRLIPQLQQGNAPWQRPSQPTTFLPFNPTTGRRYKSINMIHLMAQERTDPRWMTYDQAKAFGAQVRRGERGTPIARWNFTEKKIKTDSTGQPERDNRGQPVTKQVDLERPQMLLATVFNAQQIDGLPPFHLREHTGDVAEKVDHLVKATEAIVSYGDQHQGSYDKQTNHLYLPHKEAETYAVMVVNALTHWTRHPDRLNRDSMHPAGSQEEAQEKLCVEIARMILKDELGISHPSNASSPATHLWIKALQEDPLQILQAATTAESIVKYVLSLEHQQVQTAETSLSPEKTPTIHEAVQDPSHNETQPQERQYLAVPYKDREMAKQAGAFWDPEAKSWYVGPQGDLEKLAPWRLENVAVRQASAVRPEEEFREFLQSHGCDVSREHPIMDSQYHRIQISGDKKGKTSGCYKAYLDGRPAGYFKNFRTDTLIKWRSKGQVTDPVQQSTSQAVIAEKKASRLADEQAVRQQVAEQISERLNKLEPIVTPTPYLTNKGLTPQAGLFTDAEGKMTFIPLMDVTGQVSTMQSIDEAGTKLFSKGGQVQGCFHVVGGFEKLVDAPILVISEGYATAASVSQAFGYSTVAAFNAGNLESVARALHEKYPDKPIVIAGDDDRHRELTEGQNIGKEKALAAAQAVGGTPLFPVFAPGEASYPKDVPPITSQTYKAHQWATQRLEDDDYAMDGIGERLTTAQRESFKKDQLSVEQLTALETMKQYTDFNDVVTKSALGVEGLNRQVQHALKSILKEHQKCTEQPQRQQNKQEEVSPLVQTQTKTKKRSGRSVH